MKTLLTLALLLSLCTLTLSQQQHEEEEQMLTTAQVWGFGTLAGVGVSCIGFFAAFILVLFKKCCNVHLFDIILKFMFCLSCGALVGDAIVHILAEAYENQETNKLIVSGIFILSVFFFLIVDRILHSTGIAHSHWVGDKCHIDDEKKQLLPESSPIKTNNGQKHQHQPAPFQLRNIPSTQQLNNIQVINLQHAPTPQPHPAPSPPKSCLQNLKGKDSAGYMNIFGSAIHNFFDGLALGIAFATGDKHKIIPVVVAIIAHQIPRELGDVSILLKSQFSEMQTVLCNGFVNFLSLIGVFIGLAIVNLNDLVRMYILVFVAGNFVYIAADIWQNILKNRNKQDKKKQQHAHDHVLNPQTHIHTAECPQPPPPPTPAPAPQNCCLQYTNQSNFVKNMIEFTGLGIGIGAMFLLTLLESGDGHEH